MRKKILYCASTTSHIQNFHLPYLQFFHEMGWQVDVAVESAAEIPYADNVIILPLQKSLLAVSNLRAIYYANRLLAKNRYDIISTHTTLAGAAVRLAVQLSRKRSAKVVYTSHGYFFKEEDGLSKWPYIWLEKLLAPVTDVLMVMNRMDYRLAHQHSLSKTIVSIPGMGLDTAKFTKIEIKDKKNLKVSAGYNPDDFLIVYAAEMSKRKNQGELIRAFAVAAAKEPTLKLLLAGEGALKDEYIELVRKFGFGGRICFLGHFTNMASLYGMCDLAVSTSRCEGLPFNVMEAMASGLPVVATRIKGHIDLLDNLKEDCLYNLGDEQTLANRMLSFYRDEALREQAGQTNVLNIRRYDLEVVKTAVMGAYSLVI
jgi:glycosyltransferase EpsD